MEKEEILEKLREFEKYVMQGKFKAACDFYKKENLEEHIPPHNTRKEILESIEHRKTAKCLRYLAVAYVLLKSKADAARCNEESGDAYKKLSEDVEFEKFSKENLERAIKEYNLARSRYTYVKQYDDALRCAEKCGENTNQKKTIMKYKIKEWKEQSEQSKVKKIQLPELKEAEDFRKFVKLCLPKSKDDIGTIIPELKGHDKYEILGRLFVEYWICTNMDKAMFIVRGIKNGDYGEKRIMEMINKNFKPRH